MQPVMALLWHQGHHCWLAEKPALFPLQALLAAVQVSMSLLDHQQLHADGMHYQHQQRVGCLGHAGVQRGFPEQQQLLL